MKLLSNKLFVTLISISVLVIANPIKDDSIVFLDEDESENQILKSSNDNFRLDPSETIKKELENGAFYQGDIILLPEQKELLQSFPNVTEEDNVPTRTGLISEQYRWPKNNQGFVILPFEIDSQSQYSNYQKQLIRAGMDYLEHYTCVRFVPRTTQPDYVHIHSGNGCSSNMGKIGGRQKVSLKKGGCFSKGTIMHEMIHALGYDHMHSHADRDRFVEIKYRNIQSNAVSNFDKVNPRLFSNFGTSYDLWSVMHYDGNAFSKNGEATIIPRNRRFAKVIGQREGLSRGDALRINNMYECPGSYHGK